MPWPKTCIWIDTDAKTVTVSNALRTIHEIDVFRSCPESAGWNLEEFWETDVIAATGVCRLKKNSDRK